MPSPGITCRFNPFLAAARTRIHIVLISMRSPTPLSARNRFEVTNVYTLGSGVEKGLWMTCL